MAEGLGGKEGKNRKRCETDGRTTNSGGIQIQFQLSRPTGREAGTCHCGERRNKLCTSEKRGKEIISGEERVAFCGFTLRLSAPYINEHVQLQLSSFFGAGGGIFPVA
jgi:hypothetical protein